MHIPNRCNIATPLNVDVSTNSEILTFLLTFQSVKYARTKCRTFRAHKNFTKCDLRDLRDILFAFLFFIFTQLLMCAAFLRIFCCATFLSLGHLKQKTLLSGE